MKKWSLILLIAVSFGSPGEKTNPHSIVFYDTSSGAPYLSGIDIIGEGRLVYAAESMSGDESNPNKHLLNISGSINGRLMSMVSHQDRPDLVRKLCANLKRSDLKEFLAKANFENVTNSQVLSAINNLIDEERNNRGHSLDVKCISDFTRLNENLYWLSNSCRTRDGYGGYSVESCQNRLKAHDSWLAYAFAYASIISKLNEEKLKAQLARQQKTQYDCRDIYENRRAKLIQLSDRVAGLLSDSADIEKSMNELASLKASFKSLPDALNCINTGLVNVDEIIKSEQDFIKENISRIELAEKSLERDFEKQRFKQVLKSCSENKQRMYNFDLETIDRIKTKFEVLELLKPFDSSSLGKVEKSINEVGMLIESFQMINAPDDCLTDDDYKAYYLDIINQRSSIVQQLNRYKAQANSLRPVIKSTTAKPSVTTKILDESALTDKMATYATVIGRAIGCGYDVSKQSTELGRWIDKTFSYDLKMKAIYTKVAADGMAYHADLQSRGSTPTTCTEVSGILRGLRIR